MLTVGLIASSILTEVQGDAKSSRPFFYALAIVDSLGWLPGQTTRAGYQPERTILPLVCPPSIWACALSTLAAVIGP